MSIYYKKDCHHIDTVLFFVSYPNFSLRLPLLLYAPITQA
ncbi:hypothetical protein HMPREF9406_1780 [Clostridium sp. HGF2]|nr:hypothetical protein HMPREF9406_1780 [Clostridium sp. HGF2]EQJ53531.1 hypothetical protein QSI_3486 [Clostridioides difficile P28]